MLLEDPRTPQGLHHILAELKVTPAHRWGQNFLADPAIFSSLAQMATDTRPDPEIVEIGPGIGGLTLALLERGARVTAIELDKRMKPALEAVGDRFPGRLTLIWGDALTVSWRDAVASAGMSEPTVVGNLPYYITAPLLGRLMTADFPWKRAVLMMQREVADRLLSEPGVRNTSVLSVLMRYNIEVHPGIADVPPQAFVPAPEVHSAVLQLLRRPPLAVDRAAFAWVVRAGFQHRRKMLRQALSRAPGNFMSPSEWSGFLHSVEILDSARAEELTLEQWTRLAMAISQRRKESGS